MAGALEGVKVLDLSTLVQGPQAAALLHDLGADVIKVELPEIGDLGRHIGMLESIGISPVYIACNRGKRSLTLDLRVAEGKAVLEKLCESADVVLSNFQPGTLEEWGLGYEQLKAINPRIIWAAGSFLGHLGEEATREGADMVGQAYGGMMANNGSDGGSITPAGGLVADHCGSLNLTAGILAALYARERTGEGQQINVSLVGGQIWAQASEFTHYFHSGETAGRANGGHPLVHALYGVFATKDGHLAFAGCPEHLWPKLVEAVEHPELLDNPRFGTYVSTPEIKKELFEAFEPIMKERTTAEWNERLSQYEQRFAPVRTHDEVAADPQVLVNNYIVEVEHAELGKVKMIGSPINMTGTPTRWGTEWAELGQHTEEILLEHGYDWEQISALRDAGAL